VIKRRQIKQLAWREYLPMGLVLALWAVIVLVIGHAAAARLLAATVFIRAIQLLTRLATSLSLRRRMNAPKAIRRQSKRAAFNLQASSLIVSLLLVVALVEAMKAIGQPLVAAFLPFLALGMPARFWRLADVRTVSAYFRLALGGGGLVMVLIGWAAGWQALGMAFAFGAREWIAYAVLRWWPRAPYRPKIHVDQPLHFTEVARNSAIIGRRLLTYRLTKTALTLFGPIGNIAARTGRGLNWHSRLEPYMPHHLGGFLAFSLAAFGGAAFFVLSNGGPAAMVAAAGLAQIGAAAANVLLLWRWMPARDGEVLPLDDDEE
jgi:hypothetical protein